jgi:hypothetical protein
VWGEFAKKKKMDKDAVLYNSLAKEGARQESAQYIEQTLYGG